MTSLVEPVTFVTAAAIWTAVAGSGADTAFWPGPRLASELHPLRKRCQPLALLPPQSKTFRLFSDVRITEPPAWVLVAALQETEMHPCRKGRSLTLPPTLKRLRSADLLNRRACGRTLIRNEAVEQRVARATGPCWRATRPPEGRVKRQTIWWVGASTFRAASRRSAQPGRLCYPPSTASFRLIRSHVEDF